jgi:hypothetical protein
MFFSPHTDTINLMTRTRQKDLHDITKREEFGRFDVEKSTPSSSPQPRYSKEEFAQRGNKIYEHDIQPCLTADDKGKFVVIDIETGLYEIDTDEIAASDRLLVRRPEAQMWLTRVGFRGARRFGPRRQPAVV